MATLFQTVDDVKVYILDTGHFQAALPDGRVLKRKDFSAIKREIQKDSKPVKVVARYRYSDSFNRTETEEIIELDTRTGRGRRADRQLLHSELYQYDELLLGEIEAVEDKLAALFAERRHLLSRLKPISQEWLRAQKSAGQKEEA